MVSVHNVTILIYDLDNAIQLMFTAYLVHDRHLLYGCHYPNILEEKQYNTINKDGEKCSEDKNWLER